MTPVDTPPQEDRETGLRALDEMLGTVVGGRWPEDIESQPACPPQPPLPSLGRRRWPILLLAVFLLLSLAVTLVPLNRSPAQSGVPGVIPSGSTVAAAHAARGGELVVRTPAGQLALVEMANKQLVTKDDQSLALASVRLDDTLTMLSETVVVDTAQARASIEGIVALAPDPEGDALTIRLSPTRTILLDIGVQTRINGQVPSVSSRMSLREADRVWVVGVLDTTLDEMTQTATIDPVGPSRSGTDAANTTTLDQAVEHAYATASPSLASIDSSGAGPAPASSTIPTEISTAQPMW